MSHSHSQDQANTRPMFPEYLQPPPGFGKLSTVCDQPRGHTPKDGVNSFVIARPGVITNHGIDRSNNDEADMKAPLHHPEFEAYYNYEGRKFNDLTAFEKRQLVMAVHYPHIKDGVMKAPFYFRRGSLSKLEETQSESVKRVFGTREIFEKIFAHLIPRYEDLSSLCAASQFTARMVQSSWMHLDATGIDFLGWDENCLADVRVAEARKEESSTKSGTRTVLARTFSPTVIISPVRPENQGPTLEVTTSRTGYPLNPSVKAPEKTSFAVSMSAHYKLFHFSYLNGYAIKHLVLHGMPWMTVATLKAIISWMPRLEALGVHQCFLLTFGDTQPLLRAMNTINKDRSELTPPQPHIAVDYSPFYYKGPPYQADGSGHAGEYGIVPEEKKWLDSQRAVTAQLLGIWSLCRKGHQDFFTPGTGFRAFLDRLPLRGMTRTLRYIAAVDDFYIKKHHYGVCKSYGATHIHYDGLNEPPIISEELKQAMEITVWQDLIIACNNGPMLEEQLRNLLVLRGEVKLQRCRECEIHLPAYFFTANVLAWQQQDIICHGCQLQLNLEKHVWLLHHKRRALSDRIFRGKNKELSLWRVIRRIDKPATVAWTEFGSRDAIKSIPGAVDLTFLKQAHKLWEVYTVGIHLLLEGINNDITALNRASYELPSEEEKTAERAKLERKAQWCKAMLGTNQRKTHDGSLDITCLSWEDLIKEKRADMAIRNGGFVNRGPMHILDLRANAISMLGRSGGLPEYWKEPTAAVDSSMTDLSTRNNHYDGSSHSATSSSQTLLSRPVISSQTTPSPAIGQREANEADTKDLHEQLPQEKLLPHQRRPQKAAQTATVQPPAQQQLLPHQRRPNIAPKSAGDGRSHHR